MKAKIPIQKPPLYKSCMFASETTIKTTKGKETNISFIPNWCGVYARRCKRTMVVCHHYKFSEKFTGKMSGEK